MRLHSNWIYDRILASESAEMRKKQKVEKNESDSTTNADEPALPDNGDVILSAWLLFDAVFFAFLVSDSVDSS